MNAPTLQELDSFIFGDQYRQLSRLLAMHPLELKLGTRARNAIASAGIVHVGDLTYAREYLATVRNCGEETLAEIRQGLQMVSLDFKSPNAVFAELCELRRLRERIAGLIRVATMVGADAETVAISEKVF